MILAIVVPASTRLWGMFEIRFAAWAGWTTNAVREPVYMHPVQRHHPLGPLLGQPQPVAADRVVARAAGVLGADLESRGVDHAVELEVLAVGPHPGFVDPLDASALGVDQVGVRSVERLQVLVVETRPLAQLAIPRLERLGGGRVVDDLVDPSPDLGHLLVVALVVRPLQRLGRELRVRSLEQLVADPLARCRSIRPSRSRRRRSRRSAGS